MNYRYLGNSGLRVSELALGTYETFAARLDRPAARLVFDQARDLGINFFDTADTYAAGEAERMLGEFARDVGRDRCVLATKCYFPMSDDPNDCGLSRKHLVRSVDRSLGHLGSDYIDLLQCHRFDEETPLEETLTTLDSLVRLGKIRYWGVSRWSEAQMRAAHDLTSEHRLQPGIGNQWFYNLFAPDAETTVFPACQELGFGAIVYSPLAKGVLAGRYRQGVIPADSRAADEKMRPGFFHLRPPEADAVERLAAIAARCGRSLAELAIAWCLNPPQVASVIVGASNPKQLIESAKSVAAPLDEALHRELSDAARLIAANCDTAS